MNWTLTITDLLNDISTTMELENGRSYTLGQANDADVHLPHPAVSAGHARLDVTATHCTLTDLDSSTGTLLKDPPIPPNDQISLRIPPNEPIPLQAGSVVEIGLFQLELHAAEEKVEVVETAVFPQTTPAKTAPAAVPEPVLTLADPHALAAAGFDGQRSRYVEYLPALYDTPFMHRFLSIFESVLTPIVWRIDNLDLFLDPQTTPEAFLPWLANWYTLTFDHTWDEARRRQLLQAAPQIFHLWGTAVALRTILNIYTGHSVQIIDQDAALPPFTFRVVIPLPEEALNRGALEKVINAHKPAHTRYELIFDGKTHD